MNKGFQLFKRWILFDSKIQIISQYLNPGTVFITENNIKETKSK